MSTITYEIHPAIGVARLGSSTLDGEDGYFLGPEPDGTPPVAYRDKAGNLKRQAARFRVFACQRDDEGRLIDSTEVSLDSVHSITWTVHLANRKGIARRRYGSGPGSRNAVVRSDESDRTVIIDPGPRSVRMPGDRQVFDGGRFHDTVVPLGEIKMERDGRLRVLGGFGRAGSDPKQGPLTFLDGHFADNANWFDDTSDGPVCVTIELPDGTVATSQAWVIVGPPDFAPGITNLVTLYDVLFDLAVTRGLLPAPTELSEPLSFRHHVRPLLQRAVGYRWVNRWATFGGTGKARVSGFGVGDTPGGFWAALADPSPQAAPLRRRIVDRLRNPDPSGPAPQVRPLELMPRISDALWRRRDEGNVLTLTPTQYKIMLAWAEGAFVNDLDQTNRLRELLPDGLDRLAIEACVGGPLYPGVEVEGTVITDASRFLPGEPFRLSHQAVLPGEVTCYNAVPWQADFLSCRWQETEGGKPRQLGWWPAQRPDDVFLHPNAKTMVPWDRGLGEDYQDMVDKWDRLGFLVNRGSDEAPFFIETERDSQRLDS